MASASACGKTILLGEHAVVYGRPAIAVPISGVRASAEVQPLAPGSGVLLEAPDLNATWRLDNVSDDAQDVRALRQTVYNTLARLGVPAAEACLRITVSSQLPIARGLGSGTALTTALVRALVAHYGGYVSADELSDIVYQTEILYHGTPSGVDNTVVAHERPVYFVRGAAPVLLGVGRPFGLVIADTGVPSPTRDAVQDVRRQWQADPARYEQLYDAIGALTERGRDALAHGDAPLLGELMDANHAVLRELGVSSPLLDRLVRVARTAGALGAKLTGGGRGGCLVALVPAGACSTGDAASNAVGAALLAEGAASVYPTVVS